MQRFETVMEPTGTFAIFDLLTGLPAEYNGRALIGLSRDEADAKVEKDLAAGAPPNPLIVSDRWPRRV